MKIDLRIAAIIFLALLVLVFSVFDSRSHGHERNDQHHNDTRADAN